MAHRWTPKDIKAAAVARVVAGDDVGEITRDAGVKFQTVYRWVKRAGAVAPAKALARQRDQRLDDAVALVTSGMSVSDAAATLGMSPGALYPRLAKAGVVTELQQKPRITPQQKDAAVKRVLAGEPVDTVAAAFDRSVNTVFRWVRQARQANMATSVDAQRHAHTRGACVRKATTHSKVNGVPAALKTRAGSNPAAPAEDLVNVGRGHRLSFEDRLEIQHGCSQGRSARQIATLLGRHHSVITREIARNGLTVPVKSGGVVYFALSIELAA